MDKTIIDKDGNVIIDHVVVVNNKFINYNYELKEDEQLIDYDKRVNELIKPRWNGTEWVEGATEEEIQASKEEKEENEENIKPSAEERILVLESAIEDLATIICELSEGVKSNG